MKHVIATLAAVIASPVLATNLSDPVSPRDFLQFDAARAELGQLLFYDKILSGNRNISCATCHHHDLGSGDGVSLGIGEGGIGLGPDRYSSEGAARIHERIPRNAPALWNLGHKSVRTMFHDGRVEVGNSYGKPFDTPAKELLPDGIETVLAAQALFPLTSNAEMAGDPGENEVADAVARRIDGGWPILAERVRTIPAYGEMFVNAFDHIEAPEQVTIAEIANAIAAFIGTEWANYDSPYDKWLAGDETALAPDQKRGMDLFFGAANCSSCHAGPLLTDQEFHALALPQFGPGRTTADDPVRRDIGRMLTTGDPDDAYRFRTPSLRNVALTGPWGHNGACDELDDMVRHVLDPIGGLQSWKPEDAGLPRVAWLPEADDFAILADRAERARLASVIDVVARVPVSEREVADLVAFLHALTGESALNRPMGRPDEVPSGLPVD